MQEAQYNAAHVAPPTTGAAELGQIISSKQKRSASSAPLVGPSSLPDTADAAATVLITDGAATGSVELPQAPAQVSQQKQQQQQQQQQGVSSAEHGRSASPADGVGSACSRRFTPDQQAVAAALMVVLKRVMKDGGSGAAFAAKVTLISNNQATEPFLAMLPDEEPLPTLKHVEQQASAQLLESLSALADQCKAAKCQPLEVFTRSMLCLTHWMATESIAAKGRVYERQQRFQAMSGYLRELHGPLQSPAAARETEFRTPQEMGPRKLLADLAYAFLKVFTYLQRYDCQPNTVHRADLDHMLPGRPQRVEAKDSPILSCLAVRT